MTSFPRYAVLFKTHFWDDFAERQFRRLCRRAGPGAIYIVVDETKGVVSGIQHENVVRMTEQMSEAEGYLRYPAGNVFWYNTDYQLYHFLDAYPDYEYIFMCEYDCTVNVEISAVIENMALQGVHFVGERIRTRPSTWHWAQRARPYYAEDANIEGRLVSCAAFSRALLHNLQTARREHTRRVLAQQIQAQPSAILWPNNEAFIGAEIAQLSAAELPLSTFGDTAHYDWAPPHLEAELPSLSGCAVVHPVLDVQRYMRSLLKLHWDPEDLFQKGSRLHCGMEKCDSAYVIPMFLDHFGRSKNWAAVDKLRAYASERIGGLTNSLFNVARGKPTTQSSTSRWSRSSSPAQDASGAVNGQITGRFGFHTDLEDAPWWCVDLETIYPVREVCIYNRMDHPNRARSLVVSASTDLMYWTTLYRHEGAHDFGGADGSPLRIALTMPIKMRFLRIHLSQPQLLHLDEVEVFV